MDTLTIFGALAVSAMLLFYALEARSDWFVVALRRWVERRAASN